MIRQGGVVDCAADFCDHLKASGLIGGGIGDEDGDGEAAAVGQHDQSDVVGRGSDAGVYEGCAGFVGDDGAGREIGVETAGMNGHPFQEQISVCRGERGTVADDAKQADGGLWLKPISILKMMIAMESALVVL